MKRNLSIIIIFFLMTFLAGFDYSNNTITLTDIHSGGPPKDGIPALYDPKFISAGDVDYLQPEDRILGLYINYEAKAYPIRILNWHELVNDRIGNTSVLVSYCPLCATGMAFEADMNGERMLFGVSGQLYNSDVLFYDNKTEGLWSQIGMEAVTGPMAGTKLQQIPLVHTTWRAWKEKYPDTKALSTDTGLFRDYSRNPYEDYQAGDELLFPVKHQDRRLNDKDWVMGVIVNGRPKAYFFEKLKTLNAPLEDTVGGKTIFISYDVDNESALIRDDKGQLMPSTQLYWFAWAAFYPTTELYY
ncbi:MAG: DUF3179 domain-containing protein [Candidatus Omnitrophica bacterium]|nr:DUF3179 domain-containing protein [Candidatus Omnitrophota bacterium]